MRLLLQGEPTAVTPLDDLWLVYDESSEFSTTKYLIEGYTKFDSYLVGGGGGGGGGGRSYHSSGGINSPGGGAGGGGGGVLVRLLNQSLFQTPDHVEFIIGKGGAGGTNLYSNGGPEFDGKDGGESYFLEGHAYGGKGGGGGVTGTAAGPFTGGSGGGSGGPYSISDGAMTYWSSATPAAPAKGDKATNLAGSGGNGATVNIPPTNGEQGVEAAGLFGNIMFGGGGGGGGGVGASGLDEYALTAKTIGGFGGPGWNTPLEEEGGQVSPVIHQGTGLQYFKGATGGGGGQGHDLTVVSRIPGLTGVHVFGYPERTRPGAGGHGGYGGYSPFNGDTGSAGLAGADGILLIRIYRD